MSLNTILWKDKSCENLDIDDLLDYMRDYVEGIIAENEFVDLQLVTHFLGTESEYSCLLITAKPAEGCPVEYANKNGRK